MVAGIDDWLFKWADSISSEEEYFEPELNPDIAEFFWAFCERLKNENTKYL